MKERLYVLALAAFVLSASQVKAQSEPGEPPAPGEVIGEFPKREAQITLAPVRRAAVAPDGRFGDIMVRPRETLATAEGADEHGYVEYRFQIENRSEQVAHRVTLILPQNPMDRRFGDEHYLQAIRRSAEVGPGERTVLTLWQPDVPAPGSGARVEVDGTAYETPVEIQVANRGNRIVNSRFSSKRSPEDLIVQHSVLVPQRLSRDFAVPGSPSQAVEAPDAVTAWPTSWLAYSSYDGVVVTGADLKAAPAEVQTALWKYAETGGTLVILGPGPSLPAGWSIRKKGSGLYYPGFGQCLVTDSFSPSKAKPPGDNASNEQDFSLARSVSMWSNAPWHQLVGPDDANRRFPVLENIAIPIRGLFVIMLVCSVLMGPVNIWLLSRWKRRIWLLWTVPAMSLATCSAVFGYMIISEGWHGVTRTEGITVLDETSQRATSVGWFGVYCPMTPGDGLHFDYETEVTPHFLPRNDWRYYRRQHHQPLSIDWTRDQHLSQGWVAARVPAHFMVRGSSHRLERLTLQTEEGKLSAVNGLNAPLKQLWVADAAGTIHEAVDVAQGARVMLSSTKLKAEREPAALYEVFGKDWLQPLERQPEKFLAPNTYLAVCDGTPFFDAGLPQARDRRGRSVVVGISKQANAGGNDAR